MSDARERVMTALNKHGCSNHGCRVGFYARGGMGTNGACHCLSEIIRDAKRGDDIQARRKLEAIFADIHEALEEPKP